jgi:NTE family protein
MRRSVENVYELGLVERSDIDLDRVDGAGVLTVTVHEKPYAPFTTYLGGAYRMNDSGRSPFTLRLRVNRLEVNRAGAEWRNDLTLGSVFGLRSEFYQPLERVHRRWFLAPSLLAAVRNDALFLDNRFIGDYQHRQLLGSLELGRVVGRDLELRAGVMGGHLSTEWASGLFPIPKLNHGVAGMQASLLHDSLDSHRVPHDGLKLELRFFSPQDLIGSDVAYDRLWGQFLAAASNSKGTLLIDLQGGTDLGSNMPYYAHYYLGGLRHLSGYHVDRNRGSTFGLASVGWLHRLGGGTLPVASRTYLGFWFDTGNTWFDTETARLDDLIHSGAVSLLVETPLGPLHLGYGRSDRGHSAFHLDFGIHLGTPVN